MKTLVFAVWLACQASGGSAQETAGGGTMDQLTRSDGQQLARSTQELNQLREQIAAEKLPIAQELTSLEERVTQLRRDHDMVTRTVDAGNLEIASIKAEINARQVELDYVGILLDEYAKSFDSKV